ncbi:MAG: hypothetical protein A3Q59_01955 [Methanomethylophilus alvi]|nr:MAG: hypothetical protein A3Q59_01955 [Methanomethylophilus alvi]
MNFKDICRMNEALPAERKMEIVSGILDETGTFTLATVEQGRPKMRILGFKTMADGKIYFGIGTFKEVYAQLQADPCCEILASSGDWFMRWDGKAVFREDPRFMEAAEKEMPDVTAVYRKNGWKLAFFTIEDGHAEAVHVSNAKERLF